MRPVLLLVEDDRDDARLTLRQLEDLLAPYEVVLAKDGEEGLDYLLGRGPHAGRDPRDLPALVLLDLNMPRVTGIEMLEQLHIAWGPGLRGLKVATLSSSYAPHEMRRCLEIGTKAHIQKPVTPAQTEAMVRQVAALLAP